MMQNGNHFRVLVAPGVHPEPHFAEATLLNVAESEEACGRHKLIMGDCCGKLEGAFHTANQQKSF